jgi:hypothetical protein
VVCLRNICINTLHKGDDDDDDDDDDIIIIIIIIIITTTENSHIGHCTHTSESSNVKVK